MILETTQGALSVAARPRDPYAMYGSFRTESFAGQTVTPEGALSLPAVFGAVSLIANACGTMALEVIDSKAKAGDRVVSGGLLAPMLRYQPNEDMSGVDLWTLVFAHLLLRGNSYLAKLRGKSGFVEELVPLLPQDVNPYRGADGRKLFRVRVYEGSTFVDADFTSDAILHIKGPSFGRGIVGVSPIEEVRNMVGTQMAQSEYQARGYQDGMLVKGALSTPMQNLSSEAADRIKQQWRSAYSGIGNSHEIAVLHSGVTFQPISLSPEDAQFIQTMQWGHTQVATVFNIPASRLNGDTGNSNRYANMAQDDEAFYKQACQPRIEFVEASLNRDPDLFGARSPWVPRFNTSSLLRMDMKARYDAYAVGRDKGWLSANDVRRKEDEPEIGSVGDDYSPLGNGSGGVTGGDSTATTG